MSKAKVSAKDVLSSEDLDEALETLLEAIEIMNNKELLRIVQAHAKKRGKQIEMLKDLPNKEVKSIKDLREISNKNFESKD